MIKALKTNVLALVLMTLTLASCSSGVSDSAPAWLESDSASAIEARIRSDFSLTVDSALAIINERHPEVTADDIMRFIDLKYLEAREIDGRTMIFRKSPRNVNLLNPDYNGGWKHRGEDASDQRIAFVDSVLQWYAGNNSEGVAHKVVYRFSIDVPFDEALRGDTLRVWMPVPINSARQSDVNLLSVSQAGYVVSSPEESVHHTIYMQAPIEDDSTTHFDATIEFVTRGQYTSPEQIRKNIKPYDKSSADYKRYTAFDSRHIVRLDSLAQAITCGETDPYRCSELVYDYIINNYPWAGALEYSTIDCIPQYVLDRGYGDCGQVSLLYISLMRTLGIPARWESGWMLHPGEKNLHDWAEVYFEGVGWLPVDVSFGRYTNAGNDAIEKFYSTGIDAHRLASNTGIGGALYPPKKFVRSETVDFQLGEVESTRGNLFYPAWDSHLELISVTPVIIEQ